MDLDELAVAFEQLRERSRWRAMVHPHDADKVRQLIIAAHLVGQVQVVEHRHIPRGQIVLLNTAELLARLGLDITELSA